MALFDSFFGGKVLYYPGCAAKFLDKDVKARHEQLLNKFGIKYITLSHDEVCCGKPALDYGYTEDFNDLKRKNTALFKSQKIKKIITGSPEAYYVFKKYYDEMEIPVEHITQTILANIEKVERRYEGQAVTFFDPCNPHKLPELYDKPREILEALGLRVVDLDPCKEKSLCCGKPLEHIAPKVGNQMAQAVFKIAKTKTIITTSTNCYLHLKDNTNNLKIRELSEVLL